MPHQSRAEHNGPDTRLQECPAQTEARIVVLSVRPQDPVRDGRAEALPAYTSSQAMKTYPFDNQQLTPTEIRERVSCISWDQILRHIKAGRNTSQAILCHVPKRAKPSRLSQIVIGNAGSFQRLANSKMR